MALTLVAFVRGVWRLGDKSLWWDESLSLYRARQDAATVLSGEIVLTDNENELVTLDDHPPLYFLLLGLAVRLLGESEFALRFPSLASVVAVVPLLYITGKRLVGRTTGLAAAGLGALSPMYLWYGQEARMYALLTFFSLLSFYAFVRAFFSPVARREPKVSRGWLVAYAASALCVMLTHYLGPLVIAYELAVLGFLFLRQRRTRSLTFGLAMSALVVALGAVTYVAFELPHLLNPGASRPGFAFVPLLSLLRDLLNSFSLGLSVDVGQWYVLGADLILLLFLILGIVRLVRPGVTHGARAAGWLLFGYLAVPVVLLYLFSFVQPAYMNSRHLMASSPPFYLLVGAGLTWGRRWTVAALALGWGVAIAGMGYSTYHYFLDPAYDKDHHREWGEYLRQHVRPGDVVVVDPPHIAELYRYYAGGGAPWIGLPLLNQPPEESEARLEELLSQYDRIWLAQSRTPPWGDPDLLPERWLNDHAFRTDFREFESYASVVRVASYLPDWPTVRALPDDAHAVDIRFSPSLRLVGYRLVSASEPGKRLHVQLFWAVDGPIPNEASVSLRLVDEKDHVWGQGDQCPFNGLYPMWQWTRGQILVDEHELPILAGIPPGNYRLEAVLVSRPSAEGCWGPPGAAITPLDAPPAAVNGDRVLLGWLAVRRAARPPVEAELGIGQRIRAHFDGLMLLGVDVPDVKLKPGERLNLSLFWEARRPSLPDWQFRLRLVDSAGGVWLERRVRPVGDGYPTQQWQVGDLLQGQFWLRVPDGVPAGQYWAELVPESPLGQKGLWTTLRSWLGLESKALRLGRVQVVGDEVRPWQGLIPPVPTPRGLTLSNPVGATLGDRVRLLGYELESESVRAGEQLSVTLYWHALRAMDTSYTVFTHLVDGSNAIVAQKDNLPRQGTHPTTLWVPGEVVTDSYLLAISPEVPPGSYLLQVGMYRLETDERLPARDADGRPAGDHLVLAEIVVKPKPVLPYKIFLPLVIEAR